MNDVQAEVARLRSLARVLDESIGIPGTKFRVGLDPLIGLVPGVGDAISALLSAYIVLAAARVGVPAGTLLRMALNVLLDTAGGSIPVLGDVFDAGWKSNVRNVRLLERWAGVEETGPVAPPRPPVALIAVAIVASLAGLALVVLVARRIRG